MTVIRINTAAILEFARTTHAFDETLDLAGSEIAADARAAAPRSDGDNPNGHMADSITHEVGNDGKGPRVRISWDTDHWYGIFAELGTSKETARPFLRPAALKRRSL